MTAKVIFLNKWINPPRDTLIYHYHLQIKLQESIAEFLNEISKYSLDEIKFRKIIAHNNIRSNLRLIKTETSNDL